MHDLIHLMHLELFYHTYDTVAIWASYCFLYEGTFNHRSTTMGTWEPRKAETT